MCPTACECSKSTVLGQASPSDCGYTGSGVAMHFLVLQLLFLLVYKMQYVLVSCVIIFDIVIIIIIIIIIIFFYQRRYDPFVTIEYYCLEDQASSSIAEGKVPRKATRLNLWMAIDRR